MAVTMVVYDNARNHLNAGLITLANLKVMLRNDTTIFNAAHNVIGDLAGAEISGNGWASGGQAIGSAAFTVVNTNGSKLDGADIGVTVVTSALAASRAVVYDDSATKRLLFYIDFDGTKSADPAATFNIIWHANGLFVESEP